MKNNIINNITNNFYKMQKLFLYRIAIMIFGIFTYLFIWVKKIYLV